MKFCQYCGKEVNENAVVCVHCGCALASFGKPERKGGGAAIIFGFIMLILGIPCALIGNEMNNDIELQMRSVFERGTSDPGDGLLYIGAAVAAIGLFLFIYGLVKRSSK